MLFELLSELCGKINAIDHVRKALQSLGKEENRLFFEYNREWNTKLKLCHVAQFVLFQISRMLPQFCLQKLQANGQ